MSGLHVVFAIADDLSIAGSGDTLADAERDHAHKLQQLKERCKAKHIQLNAKKAVEKTTHLSFMGHIITAGGVKPDLAKVAAILQMPQPQDVPGVKRLCGMVQYLAKFLPNLANDLTPLRNLTRKDVPWEWTTDCERAFHTVKQKMTKAPILAYYNPDDKLTLQADSSKDGMAAVLLQQGRPIEFASGALTPAERNWAQIEKEALAVLFGLERFHQYTYGRPVEVVNDHKPIQAILQKPLSQAPKRIQALLMRLHRYDIDFVYAPGNTLLLADTLNRAYLPCDPSNKVASHTMQVNALQALPDENLIKVRNAMLGDVEAQALLKVVKNGWPRDRCQLPPVVQPYFPIRDTLSHQDDIILKGERIWIPKVLRPDMKQQLHSAHLGLASMMRRARDTIFWLGMRHDIQQLADNCHICQATKPGNPREPLYQHGEGSTPWEKVGVDICEFSGTSYLITVDYFSNFIEVDLLTNTSAKQVIHCLKRHFARYGIPRCLHSDNAQQFVCVAFTEFMQSWRIIHSTSSPGHQSANGKAEAAVKSVKNMLKRTSHDKSDQYLALLEIAIPHAKMLIAALPTLCLAVLRVRYCQCF